MLLSWGSTGTGTGCLRMKDSTEYRTGTGTGTNVYRYDYLNNRERLNEKDLEKKIERSNDPCTMIYLFDANLQRFHGWRCYSNHGAHIFENLCDGVGFRMKSRYLDLLQPCAKDTTFRVAKVACIFS